jgi:6-phosphogluconolactonase (cycloisomerase 2 family)
LAALVTTLALCSVAPRASGSILYTNNYSEKQLAAFSIGSDGLLTPLTGSPFPVPDYLDAMAIAPDGRFMVTAFDFDNLIGTFSLGADGTPSLANPPIPAAVNGAPAITPDGRFAYAPNEPNGLLAYAIGAGGALTKIGDTFGAARTVHPAITPDGRFLLAPDIAGGAIERLAIQADGSLMPLGSTPLGFKGAYVVRITPDGRFAVLLSLLESSSNDIRTFAIGADGSLTPTGFVVATTGGVTNPPVISPDGRFLYVPNGNAESITTYLIGVNGELSQIGQPTPTGLEQVWGLAMSVDGRFLYAEPQSGQRLQAFSVAANGALTAIGAPAPTGGASDGETPVARPSAPVASFIAAPGPPHGPTTFDAGESTDVGGRIVSYDWDFGDGTSLSTPGPRVNHTYEAPGVYTAKLSVNDDNGCHGFSFTGQTAYCGGRDATISVDTLPAIYSLAAVPAKFAVASKARLPRHARHRTGTVFHFSLSEDAKVTLAFERKLAGRSRGGKCVPKNAKNASKPKCTLLRAVGSIGAHGLAGKNKKRFSGKLKGHELGPGGYRVRAVAVDSAGGRSTPRAATFKILAR